MRVYILLTLWLWQVLKLKLNTQIITFTNIML